MDELKSRTGEPGWNRRLARQVFAIQKCAIMHIFLSDVQSKGNPEDPKTVTPELPPTGMSSLAAALNEISGGLSEVLSQLNQLRKYDKVSTYL